MKEAVRNALLWFRANIWLRIPRQFRTIINVLLGAAFAAVIQQYIAGNTDFDSLWDAVLIAVGTVLARALNPADDYAGIIVAPRPEDDVPEDLSGEFDGPDADEVIDPVIDTSDEQAGEPGAGV